MSYQTKDSGVRVVYEGGAQRDNALNKTKFSNIGPTALEWLSAFEGLLGQDEYWDDICTNYDTENMPALMIDRSAPPKTDEDESNNAFMVEGASLIIGYTVHKALPKDYWEKGRRGEYEDLEEIEYLIHPLMINRLQALLMRGAEKYGEDNWQKGLPLDICFDSAMRHILQWRFGDTSEDHLAAAICNLMFIMVIENKVHEGKLTADLIHGCGVLAEWPEEETW